MICQQFEIPKNEHKVQIKFQLWLIFGAHCNLFSVCRNVATPILSQVLEPIGFTALEPVKTSRSAEWPDGEEHESYDI